MGGSHPRNRVIWGDEKHRPLWTQGWVAFGLGVAIPGGDGGIGISSRVLAHNRHFRQPSPSHLPALRAMPGENKDPVDPTNAVERVNQKDRRNSSAHGRRYGVGRCSRPLARRSGMRILLARVAGYSGTPLPRKLGIKPGARLGLVRAPEDFAKTLGELPAGVAARALGRAGGSFDVIVCFARSVKELARDLPALPSQLDPTGGLWIAWPKKSSGVPTDLTEAEVRARGLGLGLVDNKVCAIDDVWSGLRFVVRLADRPRRA
jgi:hypothetical protein